MSNNDTGLLPESHSFSVTTEDGYAVDLGTLANEMLTARRNQMQDAEHESPMNPGRFARASFETGVDLTVHTICGKAAGDAFREHCENMWRTGQG